MALQILCAAGYYSENGFGFHNEGAFFLEMRAFGVYSDIAEEGHLATQNSFQYPWVDNWLMAIFPQVV